MLGLKPVQDRQERAKFATKGRPGVLLKPQMEEARSGGEGRFRRMGAGLLYGCKSF